MARLPFSWLLDYIAESPSTRDPRFLIPFSRKNALNRLNSFIRNPLYGLNYVRKLYSKQYKLYTNECYCDRGFFTSLTARKPAYENLAAIIYDWAEPSTAFDMGCGIGYLIFFLNKLGVEVFGCDKSPAVLDFIDPVLKDRISILDLTAHQSILKCDLCISMEVAEHVPKRFSNTLVTNIANCAKSHIFFTAAHPGQWGDGHINCQRQEYWIAFFSENGWAYQPAPTDDMMQRVKKDAKISALLPFIADNIMLFTK